MSAANEKLALQCPLCERKHEYNINVGRSQIFYQMTSAPDMTKRTIKKFTRVFVCPDKNEQFQAIIEMEEAFGESIDDVSVEN